MSHARRARLFVLAVLLLALALAIGAHAVANAVVRVSHTVLPEAEVPQIAIPATSAASMVLLDASSGTLLAAHNADERRPMASTTKIMTALVVLECADLDATVTVPPEAVGVEGSSIYLFRGEQITVRTLLYALMLSSANDAAAALALHTSGSISAFADRMNQKAAALGLTNTHFCNPHGLQDAAHYTTARDLAHLAAAALANPTFAEIVSTRRYSAPQNDTDAARLFLNHNRLLRTYEGAIGVKTGFTKSSGRCLVSAAERNGLRLVAVTLHDPNDWRDHAALLDWGFSQYVSFTAAPDTISLPVVGGTVGEVTLAPASTPTLTLPAAHGAVKCTVEAPRFLFAGVAKGTVVGRAIYYLGDEVLCEIPLLTETDAPTPPAPSLWERIKRFFAR
ncbi:MAG: D-alanyl-D-alanine carboxypeptidase [Clostridia bacterium]|nr:D-alanyl-D-alanine carboxypeptidase [Clostridia bacterium]